MSSTYRVVQVIVATFKQVLYIGLVLYYRHGDVVVRVLDDFQQDELHRYSCQMKRESIKVGSVGE